jgi:hypothetical protein
LRRRVLPRTTRAATVVTPHAARSKALGPGANSAIDTESSVMGPCLNPWDEGGWHHLKNVEMRNLVCRDADELHQELDLAVGRLRQKPHLVQSFFAQAGLGM